MVQKSKRQLEEWIYPTAVTVVAAYLCLEAQITHELAYVAVTHFVSITVLDLMSRPWAHPNVMVCCVSHLHNMLAVDLLANANPRLNGQQQCVHEVVPAIKLLFC